MFDQPLEAINSHTEHFLSLEIRHNDEDEEHFGQKATASQSERGCSTLNDSTVHTILLLYIMISPRDRCENVLPKCKTCVILEALTVSPPKTRNTSQCEAEPCDVFIFRFEAKVRE